MNTQIWGPGTWLFIHSVCLNYPETPTQKDKERVVQFFTLLGEVLPCKYCRDNYQEHTAANPIRPDSRKELVCWSIDLHNMVNKKLGKPIMPRGDCVNKLLCLYRKQPQNPSAYQMLYIGLVVILAVAIAVWGVCRVRRR